MELKLDELIPQRGWLHDYLHWTQSLPNEKTEVPLIFNLFVGIATIGASLKRNTYLEQGTYNIYPDIRVVLIAPTGKGKKTTAINYGRKLITKAQVTRILSETTTPEALCEALTASRVKLKGGEIIEEEADATGLIILPELSVFLEKRDYKSGLVPLLTRLGDAPDTFSTATISRGLRPLKNVALCVMAGSAKSWLTDSIPVDAFRGGFMSRFLFVVSEGSERPVARPPKQDKDLEELLIKGLKDFDLSRGPITLHDEAEDYYISWYNESYRRRSLDEKRAAYQERKHDHVLRVSMILAIADRRDVIHKQDVATSLKLLTMIEDEMFSLFGEIERGTTPQGEALQLVLSFVKKRGTVGRTELLRRVISKGITATVVDEIVSSLVAGGFIKVLHKKSEGCKPATLYQYQGEDIS